MSVVGGVLGIALGVGLAIWLALPPAAGGFGFPMLLTPAPRIISFTFEAMGVFIGL